MNDLRDHPFVSTWWTYGLLPAVRLLYELDLLDLAKEHNDILYLATELMLHRGDYSHHVEAFMDEVAKRGWATQLQHVVERSLHDSEALLATTQEQAMEAHAKHCANPNCEVRRALDEAQKVATEALGLHNKKEKEDDV